MILDNSMIQNSLLSPEALRRRKNLKKGIDFTLLVIGQEGSGKVSFINTLCNQTVLDKDTFNIKPEHSSVSPGIDIVKLHVNITDDKDSTPIALDIVMTPGFGDNIDNSRCITRVVDFIEREFDQMLEEECSIQRNPKFKDGRPHVALFFIKPTSRGLREMDVIALKRLTKLVNVIPVIAKADSLTDDELKLNKRLIMGDIRANKIKIYDFSTDSQDNEAIAEAQWLFETLPFAVAGSYEKEYIDGKMVHTREYDWGTMHVEDTDHTDFTTLRNSLFGSHLEELKTSSHQVLYESWRRDKLASNGGVLNANTISSNYSKPGSKSTSMVHPTPYVENLTESNVSLTELFKTDILGPTTLLEIERKKKQMEAYMADLKNLEMRLRNTGINA